MRLEWPLRALRSEDLKSAARWGMPVRVRLRAPVSEIVQANLLELCGEPAATSAGYLIRPIAAFSVSFSMCA